MTSVADAVADTITDAVADAVATTQNAAQSDYLDTPKKRSCVSTSETSKQTKPLLTLDDLVELVNLDDTDPISLEPIADLDCFCDLEIQPRKYKRVDALAWFEMIVHQAKQQTVQNPLTLKSLSFQDQCKIFEAVFEYSKTHQLNSQIQRALQDCLTGRLESFEILEGEFRIVTMSFINEIEILSQEQYPERSPKTPLLVHARIKTPRTDETRWLYFTLPK